ncbi:MAG TPA: MerR family transcriptional regulator [Microlunatus sp.]|nr:MerR family transcriptional regulator [Microlunatus sp.]
MAAHSGDDRGDRPASTSSNAGPPPSQGVYGIGVTADLVGTGPQNIRAYEKAGLLTPDRTPGGSRLYSSDDLDRLRRIQTLLGQGLNLAGIALVLQLESDNQHLRTQLDQPDQPPDEPESS